MPEFTKIDIINRVSTTDDIFTIEDVAGGKKKLIRDTSGVQVEGTRINKTLLQRYEDTLDYLVNQEEIALYEHKVYIHYLVPPLFTTHLYACFNIINNSPNDLTWNDVVDYFNSNTTSIPCGTGVSGYYHVMVMETISASGIICGIGNGGQADTIELSLFSNNGYGTRILNKTMEISIESQKTVKIKLK